MSLSAAQRRRIARMKSQTPGTSFSSGLVSEAIQERRKHLMTPLLPATFYQAQHFRESERECVTLHCDPEHVRSTSPIAMSSSFISQEDISHEPAIFCTAVPQHNISAASYDATALVHPPPTHNLLPLVAGPISVAPA